MAGVAGAAAIATVIAASFAGAQDSVAVIVEVTMVAATLACMAVAVTAAAMAVVAMAAGMAVAIVRR